MKKVLTLSLLFAFCLIASNAFAYMVYTDRASFTANLPALSLTTHDFESDSGELLMNRLVDFGDFTIDGTRMGTDGSIEMLTSESNTSVYLNAIRASEYATITFDNDITALGFDYEGIAGAPSFVYGSDPVQRVHFLNVGTNNTGSGFFGVIAEENETFNAENGFIFGSYGDCKVLLDNLTYSGGGSSPAPVPEPATILLLGTGLVGLFCNAKRKLLK